MKTSYEYQGNTILEFVHDGDDLTVKIHDAEEVYGDASVPTMVGPLGPPPSPYTKRQRGIMGLIRAMWVYIFIAIGAFIDVGISALTDIDLPPWTAVAIGGALYAIKRIAYPDTTL